MKMKFLTYVLLPLLMMGVVFSPALHAEEAASPDAVIKHLMNLKPDEIAAHLEKLKVQAAALETESKTLREQAKAKDTARLALVPEFAPLVAALKLQTTSLEAESKTLREQAKAKDSANLALGPQFTPLIAALKLQATAIETESKTLREQAKAKDVARAKVDAQFAPLVPFLEAMKPKAAPSGGKMKMAADKGVKHVNYMDDILPIFEARCFSCHRDDKRKGGLSLSTFSQMMEGGSSGEVTIAAGDPDGSRLYQMVLQEIDPVMPPRGKPLSDPELELIKKWIDSGLREQANSQVKVAKKEMKVPTAIFSAAAKVEGPPPMPEVKLAAYSSNVIRPSAARAMTISPTAPLMALGGSEQVLLFNIDNFTLLGVLPFEEGEIYTMTFSRNGEMLFVGGGREGDTAAAALFTVRTGERVGTYGKGYDTVLAGDISPDHAMLALGGPDNKVRVYDTADGEMLYECTSHTDWIYSLKFSPDGELLGSADRAGGLYYWQASNGRAVEPLKGHTKAINDMAYTLDSNLMATAGDEGSIIIWDTWKYKQIRKIKAHNGRVLSLDYRKDGHLVSCGSDGETKVWNAAGKEVKKYEKMTDWAYQTRYGKEGSLVFSTDWSGNIIVWDSEQGKRVAELSTKPEATPAAVVAKAE